MMMGRGYGFGMMGGIFMLIPLILIGVIIYAVVKLSQGSRGHNEGYDRNDALDILNQRYAKGEISEEEYKQKKKMLRD